MYIHTLSLCFSSLTHLQTYLCTVNGVEGRGEGKVRRYFHRKELSLPIIFHGHKHSLRWGGFFIPLPQLHYSYVQSVLIHWHCPRLQETTSMHSITLSINMCMCIKTTHPHIYLYNKYLFMCIIFKLINILKQKTFKYKSRWDNIHPYNPYKSIFTTRLLISANLLSLCMWKAYLFLRSTVATMPHFVCVCCFLAVSLVLSSGCDRGQGRWVAGSVKFSQLSRIQTYACLRLRPSYFCCRRDDNNLEAPNQQSIRSLR